MRLLSALRRDVACRQAVALMTDYLDGALPPRQRARLERHLRACDGCDEYLRQLRATVRLLGSVQPEDLDDSILDRAHLPPQGAYQASMGEARRESIRRAWKEAGGDYKAAAEKLGLHPNSLLRLIRNLGLRDSLKA